MHELDLPESAFGPMWRSDDWKLEAMADWEVGDRLEIKEVGPSFTPDDARYPVRRDPTGRRVVLIVETRGTPSRRRFGLRNLRNVYRFFVQEKHVVGCGLHQ